MPKFFPADKSSYEAPPAGMHPAICTRFIDLGTQSADFKKSNGEIETKIMPKIIMAWEIIEPELRTSEGKPYAISKTYTFSCSEKANLRKDMESWRGKSFTKDEIESFDFQKLIGKPCALTVSHKQKGDTTYAEVAGIAMLSKRMMGELPITPESALLFFDLADFQPDVFEQLSDRLKSKIMLSPEYAKAMKKRQEAGLPEPEPVPVSAALDDEIPF